MVLKAMDVSYNSIEIFVPFVSIFNFNFNFHYSSSNCHSKSRQVGKVRAIVLAVFIQPAPLRYCTDLAHYAPPPPRSSKTPPSQGVRRGA